jgi:hypothetical protein
MLQKLTTLTSLDLSHNPLVDSSVAQCIAANCTSLISLRISGCSRITDSGLIPITRRCPFLRTLDVSGLKSISDVALHELALRTHRIWAEDWGKGLSTCEEKAVQNYRNLLSFNASKLASSGDDSQAETHPGGECADPSAANVPDPPRAVAFQDDGAGADAEKRAHL